MLFMSGEVTFYKDEDFVDYLLGVRKHLGEQESPVKMMANSFKNGEFIPLITDYTDDEEREILADFIFEEVSEDPNPMLAFRGDFSAIKEVGEDPDIIKKDIDAIISIITKYSKKYNISGFMVTHPQQIDENGDIITPHIHVIYEEPLTDDPTLSEFIHSQI